MILHSDKRVRHEQTRKDSCKGRTETDGHLHSCPRHIRLISIRARMCSSRVVVRCISPPFSRVYCGRVAITHVMMQCHDAHGADTPFLIVFPPTNANPFQDMSKKKRGKKRGYDRTPLFNGDTLSVRPGVDGDRRPAVVSGRLLMDLISHAFSSLN